jgi:hypothetical protein
MGATLTRLGHAPYGSISCKGPTAAPHRSTLSNTACSAPCPHSARIGTTGSSRLSDNSRTWHSAPRTSGVLTHGGSRSRWSAASRHRCPDHMHKRTRTARLRVHARDVKRKSSTLSLTGIDVNSYEAASENISSSQSGSIEAGNGGIAVISRRLK